MYRWLIWSELQTIARETILGVDGSASVRQCVVAMNDINTEALNRINGRIIRDSVIYHDDSTGKWYRNDRADLDYLRDLMADPETASDAYSHWCAGTTSDEYDTEREAEESAA